MPQSGAPITFISGMPPHSNVLRVDDSNPRVNQTTTKATRCYRYPLSPHCMDWISSVLKLLDGEREGPGDADGVENGGMDRAKVISTG